MDAAVATPRAETVAAEAPSSCFHCGEPVPRGAPYVADVAGQSRRFCCAGCVAVARTIDGAGLSPFYAQRTASSARPEHDEPARVRQVEAALAAGLVHEVEPGTHEVSLLLDGLTCGACAWLVESWLGRQPGVTEASVNYATRRARVRWVGKANALRDVLAAIDALGYHAFVYDPATRETLLRRQTRTLLLRMGVALLAMMQVMMLATPAYLGETIERDYQALLDGAALLLTLPVVLYCALPFYRGAWRSLRSGRPGMDVPVAIGIVGAFVASVWALATGRGHVYFDSVTMFVALLLVARYADSLAREKAAAAIEHVTRELPTLAVRLARYPAVDGGTNVPAHVLHAGDVVRVDPGAAVPVDGLVLAGDSVVEEALLTGEAMPLRKVAGATVLAGSVNRGNPLVVRATATGGATTLATLSRLVERAAVARPPGVALADRAASWFVTGLIGVAIAAGLFWMLHDPSRALAIVFAVLVVSCPCALSLATPAAMAFATGSLGRHGIVAARGDALETLARVTHVVLDKTGTLTRGTPRLVHTQIYRDRTHNDSLALAAALEAGMAHPLAAALREAARDLPVHVAQGVEVMHGDGVTGTIDGVRYRLGRPTWACPRGTGDAPAAADTDHGTVVLLADERGPLARFVLDDAVRDDAAALVRALARNGIAVSLVSGDRAATAQRVARAVGIADVHGDARPADKCTFVRALQAEGAVVAMVGDGINDAPALAQADVSIAFGDASALARWSADMVVPGHDLGRVDSAFVLARRTRRVIRQNLAWALGYNAIAIPLAVSGLVSPLVAAVGMSVSSLLVVANALRLARFRRAA